LEKLLSRQIDSNVGGIVIGGSTGEGLTLEVDEYRALVAFVMQFVKGAINVFAACTAITTNHSLLLASIAEELKVDGIMCAPSPYVRPSQEALVQHFQYVHDNTALPIIVYSVPQRSCVDFSDESILKIFSMPRVCAFKDAGNDLQRILRVSNSIGNDRISFLCGNDADFLAFSANGGRGCISVASNVFPGLMVQIQEQIVQEKYRKALRMHSLMMDLFQILCIENNPAAVKYIMSLIHLCNEDVRPPLTSLSLPSKRIIESKIEYLKQNLKLECNKN
jgi:4-hydroxy-tetrahydrodipicolinate synthase